MTEHLIDALVDASVDQLPQNLYRAEQVRQLDRLVIDEQGVAGLTLMRRAGRAAFRLLQQQFVGLKKITVFCGTGNNGGDGFVVAMLAKQHGIDVTVVQCGDAGKISGEALQARQLAMQDSIEILAFDAAMVIAGDVIVDALLGTGLSGDVKPEFAAVIGFINQCELPVVALDTPSGLCSDTGRVLGEAVYAIHTVSFIGFKQGLLTGLAPDYTGALVFDDLSVPATVYQQVAVSSQRLELDQLTAALPTRHASTHKGHAGHVMVTGGDSGMAGAAAMASQSACRVGAGLVSCATRPEHISAIISRCPEVMVHGVISGQEIEPLLSRPTVVVVGPGLGQGPWGQQLLQKVYQQDVPLVVDADALNILAAARVVKRPYRDNWILTPHPAEAARLLGCSTAEIQQDRFAAVRALQQRFGGAVILKGVGSLVADNENPLVGLCPYGNPGMASGGMGDVLSGVLGALLAQGLSVAEAARLGVCLHARAGDIAAQQGQRGMVATDLMAALRQLVN
ncbi:MAG: NAD(P)H-hydrate epimerase [Oceanicoccus sp.]|jgi:NAD(P)H-hydrate epimerase